jgi:hypothetical protein
MPALRLAVAALAGYHAGVVIAHLYYPIHLRRINRV